MRKQQHVKWISIGVMVVMAGYLIHVFMQGWPHMKRGYYAGYYAAKGVVPSEFSDDMDYRFGIRLLPITSSADTVLAGAKRSTLVLKPTYHHYEAFGSEEMFPKSRWSTVIVIVVAILWVLMMVQVFLVDSADSAGMNAVYREFFTEPYPCRATVVVKELLSPGMRVEIIATAHIEG